jgi:excisionase family DNA binding protein
MTTSAARSGHRAEGTRSKAASGGEPSISVQGHAAAQPGAGAGEGERATLSVAETATLLGVSPWLVQQEVRRGSLPCVRLGRRILISRARLMAWLEDQA